MYSNDPGLQVRKFKGNAFPNHSTVPNHKGLRAGYFSLTESRIETQGIGPAI